MGQVSGWNGEPFTREGLMVRLQKFIVGDDVPPHFSCVSDRQMIPTGLPIVGPPFGSLHLAFRVPGSLPGLISPFLHLPHHEYPPPDFSCLLLHSDHASYHVYGLPVSLFTLFSISEPTLSLFRVPIIPLPFWFDIFPRLLHLSYK